MKSGKKMGDVIREFDNVHDGLPFLLGYKLKDSKAEILMANAGKALRHW